MDTILREEIRRMEKLLKQLKSKDPEVVFRCPKCGRYYRKIGNYDSMKMCFDCWRKAQKKEMKEYVKHLIGGVIKDIKTVPQDHLGIIGIKRPTVITQIVVETKDGKTVKLNKEPEVHYLL